MNPCRKLRTTALIVALAIAGLQFTGSASAAAAAMPKDACALLKSADIQALAPNANIGSGVTDTTALPMAVGCTYTWGPRSTQWGQTSLSVIVTDASKVWPRGLRGMSH